MIILKNKNYHKVLDTDIYIGRGSALGNPYSHKDGTMAMHKVDTRAEAIQKYRQWIDTKISEKDKAVCDELNIIYNKAKNGNVALLCYCAPHACHGEVLREIIEKKMEKRGQNVQLVHK